MTQETEIDWNSEEGKKATASLNSFLKHIDKSVPQTVWCGQPYRSARMRTVNLLESSFGGSPQARLMGQARKEVGENHGRSGSAQQHAIRRY